MNSDSEPEFYGEEEEEENNNKPKIDNFSLHDDEEEEEIDEKNNKKKKEKPANINITKEIEKQNENKKELNNSRDYNDEDNEQNEPDFYAEEDYIDENYQSSDSENNDGRNNKKRKQNDLIEENISIDNIYEINKKFDYSRDSPVFYIFEDKKDFNKYSIPLSTKELFEKIKEGKIHHDSIKVKLVDLFKFISKEPFSYIDLKEVLKPNWSNDVDYSNMFLELSKIKLNDNNDTKKVKEKKCKDVNVRKDMKEKENIPYKIENKNEEKKEDKKEDKKKDNNKTNKNKKKGNKKGKEIEIKTGFIYDN